MNIRTVKELAKLMKEYDLTALSLETSEGKVSLGRTPGAAQAEAAPAPAKPRRRKAAAP